MKYQDFCSPSDHEYTLMKQNYEKMQAQENEDLHELLVKMNNQLNTLKSNNADGKYLPIIDKLSSSIADLEKLISANHSQFLHKIKKMEDRTNLPHNPQKHLSPDDFFHSLQDINNDSSENSISENIENATDDISSSPQTSTPTDNSQNENTDNSTNNRQNGETHTIDNRQNGETHTIDNSPDDSIDISDNYENGTNNTPENNNYRDNIENSEDNNANTRPKSSKRNSPTQGNPLYNAIKSLNANLNSNLNRIFGQKSPQNTHTTNSHNNLAYQPTDTKHSKHIDKSPYSFSPLKSYHPQNRPMPHNPQHHRLQQPYPQPPRPPQPYPQPHDKYDECDFSLVCKNNQIDIIRLFLLYMMLRPTCKYLPTITTIANDQFDILLQLL